MQSRLNAVRTAFPFNPMRKVNFMNAPAMLAFAAVCVAGAAGCQRGHSADTVATVNGKPILRSDVEARFKTRWANLTSSLRRNRRTSFG